MKPHQLQQRADLVQGSALGVLCASTRSEEQAWLATEAAADAAAERDLM